MIRRILVGLAGTPYTPAAIQVAAELGRRRGAELTGVTVVDPDRLLPARTPAGADQAAALRERRLRVTSERVAEAVAAFEEACVGSGLRHQVIREVGDPFEALVSAARYHDVTVLGVRGLFEWDYGAADPGKALAQLIAAGVRPVLGVGLAPRPVRRVMVAYSGSLESARALQGFLQGGAWPDAEVRVVSFQDEVARALRLAQDAAAYCRVHGIEAEAEGLAGDPRDALLPFATRWGADLLVLGNSARSLLLRQAFGEVALRAMREAEQTLFLSQ